MCLLKKIPLVPMGQLFFEVARFLHHGLVPNFKEGIADHKPDPFHTLYWIAESEKVIRCLMKKKRRMLLEEVKCLCRLKNSSTAI